MKFRNKKVIIFDLDGTLIDSAPDLAHSINHMLQTLNRESFSEEIIHGWVGNGAQILVKRALSGKSEIDANLDSTLFSDALEIFLTYYAQNLCVATKPYPNVIKTLEALKNRGYTLAIVTNKPIDFVKPILDGLGLSEFFEFYLGGDSLEKRKPDPMPLLKSCEKLGVTVEQCVMVGDSKNDILAANASGMQSIGVSYGYNYGEDIGSYNPDVIYENFADILAAFVDANIAIVGGGVAGASVALYLGQLGCNVTLFEKESSLVSGPPFCHLHAGGNLYREISDKQCVTLLKQSIDFLNFYPFVVDYRPTVIAIPTSDSGSPDALLPRLELLTKEYQTLIDKNINNKVFGESENYYELYNRDKLEALKKEPLVLKPQTSDEWMIAVAKNIDFEKVQFPLILVQEYGLNLFRLASGAKLGLETMPNVELKTDTTVTDIKRVDTRWKISYEKDGETKQNSFDYLINAAGFRSGKIDDMLGVTCQSMVEFKAAYVSRCKSFIDAPFPEIIFHGERGTPQGMGQFTPYPDGHFQLHGMTKDITLYEDGLVESTKFSCQPKLNQNFIQKIENSWSTQEIQERTKTAIKHLSQFIPSFADAKVSSKPLFGAQQIPGSDPTLRVAEVTFPTENYARCEIVKVSSVVDMIDAIIVNLGITDAKKEYQYLEKLKENDIAEYARELCRQREYPISLADRNVPSK